MQPTRRPPFPCLGRPPPPYLSFRKESSTPSPCWKTREARKGEEHTLFKKGTKAWAPDRSWGRPPGQPSLLSKDAWGKEDSPLGPFARLRPGRTGGGPKKMEGTLGVGALAVVLERELRLSELPRGRLRGFPFLRKGKKDLFPLEPQDHKAKKTGRSLA